MFQTEDRWETSPVCIYPYYILNVLSWTVSLSLFVTLLESGFMSSLLIYTYTLDCNHQRSYFLQTHVAKSRMRDSSLNKYRVIEINDHERLTICYSVFIEPIPS